MYNYIDFDFNFTYNKAMKEKVPGVLGDPESVRVAEIFLTIQFSRTKKEYLCLLELPV